MWSLRNTNNEGVRTNMKYKVRYLTNYSCGIGIFTFISKEKILEWLKFHIDELEYIVIEEVKNHDTNN